MKHSEDCFSEKCFFSWHNAQSPVDHAHSRVSIYLLHETRHIPIGSQHLCFRPITFIRRNLQLDVEYDAEQSIATQSKREQFRVLTAAAAHNSAIGFHQPERFDRGRDRGLV